MSSFSLQQLLHFRLPAAGRIGQKSGWTCWQVIWKRNPHVLHIKSRFDKFPFSPQTLQAVCWTVTFSKWCFLNCFSAEATIQITLYPFSVMIKMMWWVYLWKHVWNWRLMTVVVFAGLVGLLLLRFACPLNFLFPI